MMRVLLKIILILASKKVKNIILAVLISALKRCIKIIRVRFVARDEV